MRAPSQTIRMITAIIYGFLGIDKRVLLVSIWNEVEDDGFIVVPIETPKGRSLPGVLMAAL